MQSFGAFTPPKRSPPPVPSAEVIANRLEQGPLWVVSTSQRAVAATVSAVPTNDFVYIRGMAVLPGLRGLRLGEILLHNVEQFALSRGVLHLRLSTTPFLKSACRLYARCGFRRVVDGPHDLVGTPLFTMVKDLWLQQGYGPPCVARTVKAGGHHLQK